MTENSGRFIDAIDEGLSVLGQAPKSIIYRMLESDYGILRNDLPWRFEEFVNILKIVFGPGANSILQYIIDRFYVRLQLDPPDWTSLDEAVATVQRILKPQEDVPRDSGSTLPR